MTKSEIFAEILKAVSMETEVSAGQILSCSKQNEVVDARCIYAKLLCECGFYPVQIAKYMHKTAASVRYLLAHYESRTEQNKMIAIYTQNVRKLLKNNQFQKI